MENLYPNEEVKVLEEIKELVQELDPSGGGLPDGGTTGQALVKKSDANQDVEWKTIGNTSVGIIDYNNDTYDTVKNTLENNDICIIISSNGKLPVIHYSITNQVIHVMSEVATYGTYPTLKYVIAVFNKSGSPVRNMYSTTVQNVLSSGVNIKTLNNQSLLGSGNINIEGGDNKIHYVVGQEQLIGDWTENDTVYDLYRKVVFIEQLPASGTEAYPHGISSFYKIRSIHGITQQASGKAGMPIPLSSPDSTNNIAVLANSTSIQITVGKDRTSLMGYITLEYIKERS